MHITCWGSRGSIPVSGREYNKYGGDTTCLEIRAKSDDIIIVDAGTGMRRLGNKLIHDTCRHYHILFTHAHWDHLIGFPFFKPLFINDFEIKVHRCPAPGKYVENMIGKIMAPPNFPKKYSDLGASARIIYEEGCPDQFEIGSITVVPIRLSHPNGGSGYKFIEDGKSFVFLTDNELGFVHPGGLEKEAYLKFSEGADLLIHDAEYTPEEYVTQVEWGHSTYEQALDLAFRAGVRKFGLFHLNQERSDAAMDEILKICRRKVKEKKSKLACCVVGCDMTFEL